MQARTLLDKIWAAHEVLAESQEHPAVLYIDRHLIHEVTSPQAFTELKERGLKLRRADKTFATVDHSIPTDRQRAAYVDDLARKQVETLRLNCAQHKVLLFDLDSPAQGIIHVMAPELGLIWPGQTVVCGDSHTSTHGAFGTLAFGIGTSEVAHVFASQCLLQSKPKNLAVHVDGKLRLGVSAKDLILEIIRVPGPGGATGFVIEYQGSAISALDMEARMTLCNMSIEAGARAGLIAPDQLTFDWLKSREYAPKNSDWDRYLKLWQTLKSDADAAFDREISLDADNLSPMISFGTSPDQSIAVQAEIPQGEYHEKALAYMDFNAGQRLEGLPIDVVFIGSCTNARLSDLRAAAQIFKERKIAEGLRVLVVPGSQLVKKQAEAEGLDQIFINAGAEWREPGCSLCIAMNGDQLAPGQIAVSTSNRNFAGRQGKGSKTILASPYTAAAAAVSGCITDPRVFLA